jgi:protein TonB
VAAFAAFMSAARPRRRRRLAWVAGSVGAHLVAVVLIARATLGRAADPPAVREPLFIHMPRAGSPRPHPAEAPPRPARRPRPHPPLVQPVEIPQPQPTPEPEPDPEATLDPDSSAEVTDQSAAPEPGPIDPTRGIAGGTDQALELGEVARAPQPLKQVTPQYPREARARRIEGLVVLRVIIARDGSVERHNVEVIKSIPELDGAAILAMNDWRFSPAVGHGGETVRVIIEVPFQFFLR